MHQDGVQCGTSNASVMCQGLKKSPIYFSANSITRISNYISANSACLYEFNGISSVISGNSSIGLNSMKTYTLDMPTNASVMWSLDNSNAYIVSGQGTNTITVKGLVVGNVNITASIDFICSSPIILHKNLVVVDRPNINDFTLVSSGPSCIDYDWRTLSFGVEKNNVSSCSLQNLPENITEIDWQIIPSQPIQITYNSGIYSCVPPLGVEKAGVKIGFSTPNNPYITTFRFRVKGAGGWSDWSVGHYYLAKSCSYFSYTMHPNPTTNQFTIKEKNIESTNERSVKGITSLRIIDQLGNLKVSLDAVDLVNGETVDVKHLDSGIYVVIISKNGETESKQLIISK